MKQSARPPKLVVASKVANSITDTDAWFRDNNLEKPSLQLPNPRMGTKGNVAIVRAQVPLAEMFGYSTDVRTISSGRASFVMTPASFDPVPQAIVETICKERGTAAA